jgi:hypothetical protein
MIFGTDNADATQLPPDKLGWFPFGLDGHGRYCKTDSHRNSHRQNAEPHSVPFLATERTYVYFVPARHSERIGGGCDADHEIGD